MVLVAGFNLMHRLFITAGRKPLFCPPGGVNNAQAHRVTLRYLQENPGQLHLPAEALFAIAMSNQFPCR